MSTAASDAWSLAGQLPGIIASSFSLSQMPQVLFASEEHQIHPLMLHGCILLSLVQLQSETDAHRSHFLQHQPSRRRDSACMPPSLLWQRHILPALSGHTHGEPLVSCLG